MTLLETYQQRLLGKKGRGKEGRGRRRRRKTRGGEGEEQEKGWKNWRRKVGEGRGAGGGRKGGEKGEERGRGWGRGERGGARGTGGGGRNGLPSALLLLARQPSKLRARPERPGRQSFLNRLPSEPHPSLRIVRLRPPPAPNRLPSAPPLRIVCRSELSALAPPPAPNCQPSGPPWPSRRPGGQPELSPLRGPSSLPPYCGGTQAGETIFLIVRPRFFF